MMAKGVPLEQQRIVKLEPPKPSEWMTNKDSNLMRPKDIGNLQDEIVELKRIINERDEENKLLKANAEKYERRAIYTLEKFNELKKKEKALIELGKG